MKFMFIIQNHHESILRSLFVKNKFTYTYACISGKQELVLETESPSRESIGIYAYQFRFKQEILPKFSGTRRKNGTSLDATESQNSSFKAKSGTKISSNFCASLLRARCILKISSTTLIRGWKPIEIA